MDLWKSGREEESFSHDPLFLKPPVFCAPAVPGGSQTETFSKSFETISKSITDDGFGSVKDGQVFLYDLNGLFIKGRPIFPFPGSPPLLQQLVEFLVTIAGPVIPADLLRMQVHIIGIVPVKPFGVSGEGNTIVPFSHQASKRGSVNHLHRRFNPNFLQLPDGRFIQ